MRITFFRCWYLLLFLNISYLCYSQTYHRPKIGLVFSGGGAKGMSHIGVLKVFDEIGLPIDCISGTSMGSLVAAIYSIGYSGEQIEEIAKRLDWDELLRDEVSRRNISIEEKEEDGKYAGKFPIKKGVVVIPKGLVGGYKILSVLSSLTWPAHQIYDFNQLPIPFRCVATDITNVEPVVLDHGFLPDALRASISIPSVFTPYVFDGKLLVDGGVVRNFPVQDVREMGADIIIGVDVTSSLYTRDELTSVFEIIDQTSTYQIAKSNDQQRKMCTIVIEPRVEQFDAFSYNDIDTLIKLGEQGARDKIDLLKNLADSLKAWPRIERRSLVIGKPEYIKISKIEIEGLNRVSEHVVRGNLNIHPGDSANEKKLRKVIERIYGTQFFEMVSYKILPETEGNILIIRVKEQSFNYVKFAFNYSSLNKASVLLNTTFHNIIGDGSRLLIDLRLSENPAAKLQYSIQTRLKPNIGYSLKFTYNNLISFLYNEQGKKITSFDYHHISGETELRSALSNSILLNMGLNYNYLITTSIYDLFDSLNVDQSLWSAYVKAEHDGMDRSVFPRNGQRVKFRAAKYYSKTDNNFWQNWNNEYWDALIDFEQLIAVTPRFSVDLEVSAGTGKTPGDKAIFRYQFGGTYSYEWKFLDFPGTPFMGVSANTFLDGKLGFQIESWKEKFILLRGGVLNIRNLTDLYKITSQTVYGWETGIGIKTFIGPISITVGSNNVNRILVTNLNVGFIF